MCTSASTNSVEPGWSCVLANCHEAEAPSLTHPSPPTPVFGQDHERPWSTPVNDSPTSGFLATMWPDLHRLPRLTLAGSCEFDTVIFRLELAASR